MFGKLDDVNFRTVNNDMPCFYKYNPTPVLLTEDVKGINEIWINMALFIKAWETFFNDWKNTSNTASFLCHCRHPLVQWISCWWFQPHLKNISQNGTLPQIVVKTKHIWNHHPDLFAPRVPRSVASKLSPLESGARGVSWLGEACPKLPAPYFENSFEKKLSVLSTPRNMALIRPF